MKMRYKGSKDMTSFMGLNPPQVRVGTPIPGTRPQTGKPMAPVIRKTANVKAKMGK